jgi:hypothetical protein
MRIGKNISAGQNKPGRANHKDLVKFAKMLKAANADGKIDSSERQELKQAFGKLEGREKAVAKKMMKKATGEAGNQNKKPGKRDVAKFKEIVKKALEDGKVTSAEKEAISKAFERLEPKEKKATIDKLAQNGHQRLAIALAQSVND